MNVKIMYYKSESVYNSQINIKEKKYNLNAIDCFRAKLQFTLNN